MSSQPSPQPKVAFDSFEFNPASGELRRHGRVVRLQGQPIQILEALLDDPGKLVTRESLQRRIWNGALSGDFEHGLNAAVNKLRQALGDSAEEPRFIETVPGKGYRFVAGTIQAPRPVFDMKAVPQPSAPGSQPRIPIWVWAAMLVAVGAAGYWLGTRSEARVKSAELTQFAIAPPPGFFLQGASPMQTVAVSPDGSKVAFTALDASGLFRIFIRQVGELESRELPGSTGAGTLFWLHDGSLV